MRYHGFRHGLRLFRFRHQLGHKLDLAQQQLRLLDFRFRQHVRLGRLRHLRFVFLQLAERFQLGHGQRLVVYRHHFRYQRRHERRRQRGIGRKLRYVGRRLQLRRRFGLKIITRLVVCQMA
jgi:hypothetical protein